MNTNVMANTSPGALPSRPMARLALLSSLVLAAACASGCGGSSESTTANAEGGGGAPLAVVPSVGVETAPSEWLGMPGDPCSEACDCYAPDCWGPKCIAGTCVIDPVPNGNNCRMETGICIAGLCQ